MAKNRNLGSHIDGLPSRQGKTNPERLPKSNLEEKQKPFDKIQKNKGSEHFDRLLPLIKEKYILTKEEIEDLFKKREGQIVLPISIFNEKLGMLEAASLYMKDELNLSFNDIAKLLKRDYKTIWTSYKQANKKLKNEG